MERKFEIRAKTIQLEIIQAQTDLTLQMYEQKRILDSGLLNNILEFREPKQQLPGTSSSSTRRPPTAYHRYTDMHTRIRKRHHSRRLSNPSITDSHSLRLTSDEEEPGPTRLKDVSPTQGSASIWDSFFMRQNANVCETDV